MAQVVEKLYPPTIESAIPAFFNDNGTVKITVPFSMNKAINLSEVRGLALKIKTVQSNTHLTTLFCNDNDLEDAINNNAAVFEWGGFNSLNSKKVKLGQFLKVQLAYIGASGIGYYSTVGITKYTSKPNIYIANMSNSDIEAEPVYRKTYIGIYEMTEDKTERPYSYIFNLFDMQRNLIETSSWKMHNSSVSSSSSEYLSLSQSVDYHTFSKSLQPNTEYYVQYGVKTLNNLEIYSPLYVCMQIEDIPSELNANLIATNVFTDGYIELKLQPFSKNDEIAPGSYLISKSSDKDNFISWENILKFNFYNSTKISEWNFKDFCIEQGVKYQYSIQQYNDVGIYSDKILSNKEFCDFEDMFLFDGKKQLKIRFNPKVSSFKTTILESKTNTIGNKFPFFFRNGAVQYKEFQINGLISYLTDENELFLNYEKDLKIVSPTLKRTETESKDIDNLNIATTNITGYNMKAERDFKLILLDWLNDGEIKLFKSPAEGNYLVRLMNITLSPEDKINRMINTFQASATEAKELNYNSLVDLGFIIPEQQLDNVFMEETVNFQNYYTTIQNNDYAKINNYSIYEYFSIQGALPGAKIRIGSLENQNIVMIGTNGSLSMNIKNSLLPNIYVCADDNASDSMLAAATLTYKYRVSQEIVSKFRDIKDLLIKNEIFTQCGPYNFADIITGNIKEELLRFFVLNFQKKPIVEIEENNGAYFLVNTENQINYFDNRSIYYLDNNYYIVENGNLSIIEDNEIDYSVNLNGTLFMEPPNIVLPQDKYTQISFGNGIVLDCAFQKKITEYLIEDTDTDLQRIQDKFSQEYINLLEIKLSGRGE